MAHVYTSPGIRFLTGALNKQPNRSISVTRVKAVRDPITGQVVGHGPNEFYIKEPRDYDVHPLTSAEQNQRTRWREACKAAAEIIRNKSHPRYMEMYQRWREHVSAAERPMQFPNFVRAVLSREA